MDSKNRPHLTFNRLERTLYPQIGIKSLFNLLTLGSACAIAAGYFMNTPTPDGAYNLPAFGLLFGGMALYEPSRIISERIKAFQGSAWGNESKKDKEFRNMARLVYGVGCFITAGTGYSLISQDFDFLKLSLLNVAAFSLVAGHLLHKQCNQDTQNGTTAKPPTGRRAQTARPHPTADRPHA